MKTNVNCIEQAKKNAKKGGKKESATKEKEEEEIVEELPLEPVVTENVKQFEMLDAMENGGPIEDIDLTTEDWINVQPMDMPKRYEALRRYVSSNNFQFNASCYFYFYFNSENRRMLKLVI